MESLPNSAAVARQTHFPVKADGDGVMIAYANAGGDSNVLAYSYGENYIKVLFSTGAIYLYSYDSAGIEQVEYMKLLADLGRGLNTFINVHGQSNYALRLLTD